MTPDEIACVRGELETFAAEVFEPFARKDQRRWGQVYLRGLLTDGKRKSVEPMAARLGEEGNRQALAHFVTTSPWDPSHIRARLAWKMEAAIQPSALIFDDTGFLKDGNASACVSRQYTGTAGKVTNCQVGVSLHLASDHASSAVDWRLFLPETWDAASPKANPDRVARRASCGIPDDVGHVEKWQLALDMLDETRSWGIEIPLAIADAGYGDATAFRLGVQARGLNYVVGISTTLTAHPGQAVPVAVPYSGTGRPPVVKYLDKPQSVKQLAMEAGRKAAKPVQWREGSRPGTSRSGFKRMYSRFVALRIRPAGREIRQAVQGPQLPECWLLAEWPANEPEPVQFWLSDLPTDTPLTTLVRLAKLRWRIEHDYREMKQALGLTHFEGRTFNGWHHHVTLVSVAHAFCTLQRLARAPKDTAPV
ncbi:IS701 family transposase [Streptomyces sp. NBC_00963]|uniref:IS701 family transposase n=1 Tax=unclassified Streptomyces TaxID=2593676 RepID=UPI002254D4A3|nr:IS701 family transposase [Streptomyces sp. NBC_01306]WSX40619.1 IS701 family transposase [Streptomyces sp. NBC_00963]MCX4722421.1 IS701 family transposase [Streptomyces sp. NBC_01306]MCX4723924.1 IS701 family transposase [Streptomyces sp. NBC_01306]MCX4725971.1 IS701 family transposase [Streptomyces sp. NBC_01306]MCX4726636.1 IS701 family transposase [Streptomyces sp. NBC_01306]